MGGPNEPLELFSGDEVDEVDVPATDEEETLPSRASGSSTLSGSATRHEGSRSRGRDDREKEDIKPETLQTPK